MHQVDHHLLRL